MKNRKANYKRFIAVFGFVHKDMGIVWRGDTLREARQWKAAVRKSLRAAGFPREHCFPFQFVDLDLKKILGDLA